jgi:hypothetical protein
VDQLLLVVVAVVLPEQALPEQPHPATMVGWEHPIL